MIATTTAAEELADAEKLLRYIRDHVLALYARGILPDAALHAVIPHPSGDQVTLYALLGLDDPDRD